MSDTGLRLERQGGLAELILVRPGKQNAITRGMWQGLTEHAAALAADSALRVVVLRGEPPAFSAGADIDEFADTFADPSRAAAYNDLVQAAMAAIEALPMPTIAAIEGNCIGGGCGLALACDLRFAATDARLAITPARLGLAYSLGDVKRLVDLAGPARAKDILYSARVLGADEAMRLGLVDRVVPRGELGQAVGAYARGLMALSGSSQRRIKAITRLVLAGAAEETEASRDLRDQAVSDVDFAEGRRAFIERRAPRFA